MAQKDQHQKIPHRGWLKREADTFRARLAHADALPQLAILGCISGFLTAFTAIAFRLSFELPLEYLLPGDSESFEQLPVAARFLLPRHRCAHCRPDHAPHKNQSTIQLVLVTFLSECSTTRHNCQQPMV